MTLPLPQKRKKVPMGVRTQEKRESARHRKFVRGHECIANGKLGLACQGRIEFCHVRKGLPEGEQAGVAQKPHDAFGFPACTYHHKVQHAMGEGWFEQTYGVKLLETALALALRSPDPSIVEKARSIRL